ncbi:TetR/AcrR family transcriptional regulator [Cellulomonas hominis]
MTSTRPLRADARRNRQKLLDVALQAFAEEGPDVPVETLAARAGVGVGTFYRHFPNRAALIEAAYRQEVEGLCDAAPDLLGQHALAADALREWMGRFVRYAATKRGLRSALKEALGADTALFGETWATIVDALGVLVRAGIADGSVRPDADPDDVMRAMGSVWLVGDSPDWEPQVRRLLDLIVDSLRFGAPAAVAASAMPDAAVPSTVR